MCKNNQNSYLLWRLNVDLTSCNHLPIDKTTDFARFEPIIHMRDTNMIPLARESYSLDNA